MLSMIQVQTVHVLETLCSMVISKLKNAATVCRFFLDYPALSYLWFLLSITTVLHIRCTNDKSTMGSRVKFELYFGNSLPKI